MGPDKELEQIMRKRHVPEMRSNLAERIIDASKEHRRSGKGTTQSWFLAFREAIIIPKPAFAIVVIFILGLLVGSFSAQSISYEASYYPTDFVFTAEQVIEGEWL